MSGFERISAWDNLYTDVPCRHNYAKGVSVSSGGIGGTRENMDDDVFFFDSNAVIVEGNRIVHDGNNYDVLKVSKMYASNSIHHFEVVARLVTHA